MKSLNLFSKPKPFFQDIFQEVAAQGFFEILLNIFLESIPLSKPHKGRTLAFNILTSLIIYILLRSFYKGLFKTV